jgi:hypothetical protein
MKLKPLKKIDVKDYEISRILGWIREFTEQFKSNQFILGQELQVSATSSGVSTDHKLGKEPEGFIVLDNTANATIWRSDWDDKTITLHSSANSQIKVWVF